LTIAASHGFDERGKRQRKPPVSNNRAGSVRSPTQAKDACA
jgi:hypothetical protein